MTAAILAALAAITSMLSGHHEHEAMMEQMHAADTWNQYQAKKIKSLLREERIENLQAAGRPVPESLQKKLEDAATEQKKIANEAEGNGGVVALS